jgi:hypothetical protein
MFQTFKGKLRRDRVRAFISIWRDFHKTGEKRIAEKKDKDVIRIVNCPKEVNKRKHFTPKYPSASPKVGMH